MDLSPLKQDLQTRQDIRLTCNGLNLQVAMASSILGHMTKNVEFISIFTRPKTKQLGKMVERHVMILTCRWQWRHHSRHMENMYGSIFTSTSPIIAKIDKMKYQHSFIQDSSWPYYLRLLVMRQKFIALLPLLWALQQTNLPGS